MNKDIDMFDIIIDEIELKQKGGVLTPTLKDGYVTVKEKSFLDTFDDEVRDGVDGILERLKLNEQTKKDIKATGEFVEGIGKGLFAGGIVNPLDLVLPDDSVFMQQAREAVQFDPEYKVNTFGYEASKFFGSFLGLGKLLAIGKLGSQTAKLGSFGQDALRSLASTFTGFEATDENLADAIIAMGADPEDFPVLQQLMTNPDDSEFEGRLKNVLADLPIEALVPTISTVIKSIKKGDPTAINQNTQNLEKEIKELLDKQSVGSAINPEGELAQSIIQEADIDTSASKLDFDQGDVIDINKKVKQVVDIRAEQMKLPIKDRVQPSGEQFFNRNYKTQTADQTEIETPSIDETKPFPKNNRAKKLKSFSDEIALTIANKLKDKVGSNEQFFYNTQPLIDKATELGIPEDVAKKQLEKLSLNYAATSPKSATEENLRSASLVSAKQTAKIPVDSVIGPGTVDPKTGKKGISEKGYPMMISPGGTHRKLVDAVAAEGLNVNTQPKPYSFAKNVQGNLNGVTVDSHAIRAVIFVLNDLKPGKVPIEFILPKFQKQYKKNPSKLTFDMIDASFATQARNKISYKPEYKIFSDIFKKVANNLSIKPAEAQALTWFNYGDRTGLVSKPKTFVDILEERIDVTAQLTNDSKENVFKQFMQGKLPLLSLGGITLLETGTSMENE